jgi:hypothetical protein
MTRSDFLPASHPALPDLRSCEAWLASATLADPRHACAAFQGLLEDLEFAPPAPAEYLRILERLRPPMAGAVQEHSRRFASKPLPLGHAEELAFSQVCALLNANQRAYERLLRIALKEAHREFDTAPALLATRVVACAGELVTMHCLARRRIAGETWQNLHGAYALAEERCIADTLVGNAKSRLSAKSAYVRAVLMSLAAPLGVQARESQWLKRWTARWCHKVRILTCSPSSTALAVELEGRQGASWRTAAGAGAGTRFLDTSAIGRSIGRRLARLENGEDPV